MLSTALALGLLASKPLILAHYMPWFEAPPVGKTWGWHWTMGSMDPTKTRDDRREIASHYYPQIGPYDSGDPDVLEYQTLMMKAAGIGGVVVDWYGREDVYDYAQIHRNTTRLIVALERVGMKFAICWEDQTVPNLIKLSKVAEGETLAYAKKELDWMAANWFARKSYVRAYGKPLLLVFGPQYYKDQAWTELLATRSLSVFGVSGPHMFGNGGFAWPNFKDPSLSTFYGSASGKPFIAGALPRFHDYYAEANLHASYGKIPDNDGQTFKAGLRQSLASGSPVVQIATWNDWGEGTQIEPSREFGFRDLLALNPKGQKRFELIHALFLARKAKHPGAEKAAGYLRLGKDDLAARALKRP